MCEQETVDLERLRNLLNQADEKLAAANQSLEVTRRQKNEQVRYPRLYCMHHNCAWQKSVLEDVKRALQKP